MGRIFLIGFFFISFLVSGQNRSISGQVTDTNGVPMTGVNILIQGSSHGTQTDFAGNFELEVNPDDILVFSHIGYTPQQIMVSNRSDWNVVMQALVLLLDEVLIVGYGKESRRFITDNVAKIKSKGIAETSNPNFFNALSGQVAGVQINQTNGKLESGLNIRVRGRSSVDAGSNPLYVIDGVPLMSQDQSTTWNDFNPLITLSPNEIESIDILKDASAAAIYGSRASNGVVLITTKRGKAGKTKYSINMSNAISEASHLRKFLNADEYVQLLLESAQNTNSVDFVENYLDYFSNNTWQDNRYNSDWQSVALVNGFVRDVSLSASGGNEKTLFYASGAYNDSKGIVRGNEMKRFNGRLNLDHNVFDRLKLTLNVGYSRSNIHRVPADGNYSSPLRVDSQPPISPIFVNGEPNKDTYLPNYLLEVKYGSYNTIIRRFTGKLGAQYKFLDWLSFHFDYGYDLYEQSEKEFRAIPLEMYWNGYAKDAETTTENLVVSGYASIDKKFKDKHDLNLVLGSEYIKGDFNRTVGEGANFPAEGFSNLNSAALTAASGNNSTYRFISYFARANYKLKNRYLLKASVRYDGSSRFGENRRYGTFPALSGAWIVSEENFLKRKKSVLSFLKLRMSWGETGNAEIGDYRYIALFGAQKYADHPGLDFNQSGNSYLTWETTQQTELAMEYGLWNNALSGEFSYYIKDTDGLLFDRELIPSAGPPVDTSLDNIGKMTSKGVEITVKAKPITTERFTWTVGFNLTQIDNTIKTLPDGEDIIRSGWNVLREGEPFNAFFLKEYAGVDPDNGDALYYLNTKNPDGSLDRSTTNNWFAAEQIVAGQPDPQWIGGFNQTFTYDHFDLSMNFVGEWGADIYNLNGQYESANGEWFDNQTRHQLKRWQQPGDVTDVPQARFGERNGSSASTRYLQNNDFIRLRNVTLGYNFPKPILDHLKFSKIRLYLSGVNLFTITGYDGYDPESRTDVWWRNGQGIAILSPPSARSYALGLNLEF